MRAETIAAPAAPTSSDRHEAVRQHSAMALPPGERALPRSAVTAPAVALRDVRKVHGHGEGAVVALDGISVGLAPGSFTAIMGPSGSGKSTFLHVAAGLDRPTSGTVAFGGTDLARLSERRLTILRRERIGFVFQAFNLMPSLTVTQNIASAAAPGRSARAALAGARGRGAGRTGETPGPPSLAALRRTAAAGRDRPRARHPARGGVRRRADRSARHPHRTWRARASARGRG